MPSVVLLRKQNNTTEVSDSSRSDKSLATASDNGAEKDGWNLMGAQASPGAHPPCLPRGLHVFSPLLVRKTDSRTGSGLQRNNFFAHFSVCREMYVENEGPVLFCE